MNINFALILLLLIIASGIIYLLDVLLLAKKRQQAGIEKQPLYIEYARLLFPVLLVVFLLRSFLIEPFRIPSGSLKPTLLVGDLIFTNKYTYGLRMPLLHNTIVPIHKPKVGEVVVFRWPVDPSLDYIKRFVGTSGDTVEYKDKVLFINGQEAKQEFIGYTTDSDDGRNSWKVEIRRETINGTSHKIYVRPDIPAHDFKITVPKGQYFAMGDNRDDSSDSRVWGFVPDKNIIGKAIMIWFSFNSATYSIRWDRIGDFIH